MLKTTTLAAAIALFAGAATAQTLSPNGPLDADGDGFLTMEEFEPIRTLGGQFVAYDSDGDGLVSEVEYNEGVRELATVDGDSSSLDPTEAQRYDELARLFDQEVADRDNLLRGLFGTDDTETGAIPAEDAADAAEGVATDAN